MSSTRFGRDQLISHALFTRKTAAAYQLIMLLAAAVFFAAFRLDAPAPWPLVTGLLFILMGDAMGDLIKMAFRKRARCAPCGRRNARESRYCSECGLRLDTSPAEDSPTAGDLRRSVAREMTRAGNHSPPKKPGMGMEVGGLLMFLAGVMVGGIAGRRGRSAKQQGQENSAGNCLCRRVPFKKGASAGGRRSVLARV